MTVLTIRTNLTYNSYKSVDRNIIPNVGTMYSQRGNKLFPTWEQIIPSVGNSCFTTGIDSIQCWSSIHLASCP
jgi:hypothetical protein